MDLANLWPFTGRGLAVQYLGWKNSFMLSNVCTKAFKWNRINIAFKHGWFYWRGLFSIMYQYMYSVVHIVQFSWILIWSLVIMGADLPVVSCLKIIMTALNGHYHTFTMQFIMQIITKHLPSKSLCNSLQNTYLATHYM